MPKQTVTPFGRVQSPEERETAMTAAAAPRRIESSRKHTTFATPRGDLTPHHAGPGICMHTPISEKDEYVFQVRCKAMEEVNVILSHDDSDSTMKARQAAACDSMKQFFWRTASTKESTLMTMFNFFHNSRTEESYQLDASQQSINQSQVVLFLLIVSRVAMAVWWFHTKNDAPLVGMELIADKYADPFHWMFLPFGLVAVLPFRCFNSWGKTKLIAYWIRRYWKHIVTVILMLFCVGYLIYYKMVHRAMADDFQRRHSQTTCGQDAPSSLNGVATMFDLVTESISGLQDHLYNMFLINVIATSLVLCLTLKLDFPQAVLVLGSSFLFYLLDWALDAPVNHVYRACNYFVFAFAIVLPIVTGLTAFYFIDRDARMAFFSKVDAERVNTALKHGVTVNRLQYQTLGRVGPFEEQLLLELLAKTPENALIHNVSIPFEDLTLHELMTEHAKGDVVRGEYTGLRVAIKRLSVLTRETVVEFKAHVELLACLRHPNVVQFIGASFDALLNLCVVMEYMEKGDVYTLLRTPMALEWNDPLLQIAIDAAQGIAYLHHSNVIHRDLKSENLLCTATYACKVSDFGESKQVQTQECLETMVGTPYWLAPEILRETPYHNKVDCYSFGIVLIELESRRDPYFDCDDMSTIDIMMQVAMGTLRPTIPASCPPRRRALIDQCLADTPQDRPSMVTILKALQTDIRDEVLGVNFSDPQQNRRQLLQKHQMLNRRGLHEVLATTDQHS
ncbi:hypothetical protein DYB28_013269 [Aphanomyces astaci]|uniref:Protein kinase domain-containing protein n=1 Tax=Aphanomyces astaci TaxID=112090 RepID=A0A9X8E7Y8_APHAT|nr:hypothetical protein DYB28_013269 [Aphanomyces astaci]